MRPVATSIGGSFQPTRTEESNRSERTRRCHLGKRLTVPLKMLQCHTALASYGPEVRTDGWFRRIIDLIADGCPSALALTEHGPPPASGVSRAQPLRSVEHDSWLNQTGIGSDHGSFA